MLLAEGLLVWGTSRDLSRLQDLTARHPGRFTPVVLELADGEAVAETFLAADRAAGGFDVVVNNAGYGLLAEFSTMEFAEWRDQIEAMLVQPARIAQLTLQGMLARNHGALVNISSLAAEFPLPFQSGYNVVKAGLSALNESLMIETKGTGVSIVDFRPGDYRTDFETSVRRPAHSDSARLETAWRAFAAMMQTGPSPDHAAAALRHALWRRGSCTVRTGRFFQAVVAPFLTRFGSLELKRRIQAAYFEV
jgi:short-subunit dehydrogenase